MNNRKEVKRENKQVRKLKKLRSLDSKGKNSTDRYKKLKQKVYNPFIDTRKDMKKMGAAMGKVKNPIPKYDPTPDKAFKKMVFKQGVNDFNKKSAAAQKKEASKLISKKQPMNPKILPYKYPESGAIEMTGHPGEYLMGGGAIGGFKTAKTVIGKVAQAGQRYAVQSAKKSIKPSSIVTNSL
jgi:hypothetical protein